MSKVVVVGLGYVGLPLAVRSSEVGHDVVGIDLHKGKIDMLAEGVSYVEDVSDERLGRALASGRLTTGLGWRDLSESSATRTAAEGFDVAVISVPTPLHLGVPDLSYVESAARMLAQILRPGAAVVLESTTYPGTTEGLLADVLADVSGLVPSSDFHLGFSPERIDPGSSRYTLENTPKLVSATTPAGLAVLDAYYSSVVDRTVPVSSPRIAELAKVFENTQAYVNIALVNELAGICHDLGIDVHEMIDAAMTKGHSVARWTPGPGVGGHCLPIDPMYLAWQTRAVLGRPFRLAELADEINTGRPDYVVKRASDLLNDVGLPVRDTEILVVGVAYKAGVADLRESPAIPIVEALLERGAAVTIVDPHVTDWARTPVLGLEELAGQVGRFPLTVVVTDHPEFDYAKLADQARLILDCRNSVQPNDNVVAL